MSYWQHFKYWTPEPTKYSSFVKIHAEHQNEGNDVNSNPDGVFALNFLILKDATSKNYEKS